MLRAIHLHGKLGRKFGRRFDLQVDSAAEAVRALGIQLPGFMAYIRDKHYVVSTGSGVELDREALALNLGRGGAIHITPAAPVAGITTIIIGAVLALTAIVSVVMLLNMPRAPDASSREDSTKTQSFIFDGPQNVSEQGHPVPLIYGRMRVGSIIASAGISTTDVNEASISTDPVTPGTGVTYTGYVGSTPGITDSPAGSDWVIPVSKGGKAAAGTTVAATEVPNSLMSQATARLIEIIGEGEIKGLVAGLQSIFFDGTPLQNSDSSYNYSGVAVDQRFGLPDQDFMPGYSQVENTTSINTKVSILVGPVTRTISNADATVARVTIRVPQLYAQDTTNGNINSTDVQVKISVQADGGGFTDVTTVDLNGKQNGPYQRSVDIRLPNGTTRDIRVTRLTADSTVSSLQNDTYFDLLTEVVEAKLSYPNTALIGLTVDARQFGSSIPARSYDVEGLIIEVPTNYDPVARTYSGIWDGTFKRAYSNNPAWCMRDIIVKRRYGLGARVPPSALDIWGLYQIAQYCDELVPDMFGGTEPRYTMDCCINEQADAYDVLASMASNFRGQTYWGSGSIVVVQDSPQDPSIIVTPPNVADGKLNYGRLTEAEKRRSVAVVYWNDPSDSYQLAPEIYEDGDLVRRYGRRTGDIVTGFGVTRQGHAHRLARFILEDESQGSNTSVNYSAIDDHTFATPFQIAVIADPKYTGVRRGGRVAASTADSITLDAPFTFVSGQTYSLRVMLPDGTTQMRTVTNSAGVATVVTLGGTSYSTLPNKGAVWSLESDAAVNRQFRFRSLASNDPPYDVVAYLHDPTKYERVEQNRDISVPNFILLPSGPLVPPSNLDAIEFLLQDGNAAIPCIQVSWRASADPRVTYYQSQQRAPGGVYEPFADGLQTNQLVRNVTPGNWSFRVRAVDSLSNKTAWIEKTITLLGQQAAVPNVTGLSVNRDDVALTSTLVWLAPTDPRPLRYDVYLGASLGAAILLGTVDAQEYPISQAGRYYVQTHFIDALSSSPPFLDVTTSDLPVVDWSNVGDSSGTKPEDNATKTEPAGDYDPTLSYFKGSIVRYSGASYISIAGVPIGDAPPNPTYWQLIAADGGTGPMGPTVYVAQIIGMGDTVYTGVIALDNGATVGLHAEAQITAVGGSPVMTLNTQYSIDGGGSWNDMGGVNHTNTITIGHGDTNGFGVDGVYTNSSGAKQVVSLQTQLTNVGGTPSVGPGSYEQPSTA